MALFVLALISATFAQSSINGAAIKWGTTGVAGCCPVFSDFYVINNNCYCGAPANLIAACIAQGNGNQAALAVSCETKLQGQISAVLINTSQIQTQTAPSVQSGPTLTVPPVVMTTTGAQPTSTGWTDFSILSLTVPNPSPTAVSSVKEKKNGGESGRASTTLLLGLTLAIAVCL